MARQPANNPPLVQIAAGILVVAGIYWAQPVLVPMAIAILLAFVLAPIADDLEQTHIPRVASVIVIISLVLGTIFEVGFLVANQAYSLADSLPKYRQNIEERMRFFTSNEPGGVIDKATKTLQKAQKEVAKENKKKQETAFGLQAAQNNEPIPVEIHRPPPTGFELVENYASTILGPLGQAVLVFVFVIFILLQREDLRDRMIRLLGQNRLDITTRALDDAGSRISRYLLMQLIINLTYGLSVAVGLWLMGLPGALLWGVLAAVLRFIPFLGSWLAAAMPIVLSLAVFDGWYWPLAVVGLFVVLEFLSNNLVEPWLYGSSTGMSPIGVILAIVFWSALWGLVGLVVAIPLTVCLVVAGQHLPQFRFFTILFGRDPALTSAERCYQRLLAGDQDEIEELAYNYVSEQGLVHLYDEIITPAMHLAERNRHAGQLGDAEVEGVFAGMSAIVEKMEEWQMRAEELDNAGVPQSSIQSGLVVLCLPARDKADELAATLFAQVLRAEGMSVEIGSAHALVGEVLAQIDELAPSMVCLSALPPLPPDVVSHVRYLCRRLHDHDPSLPVLVGLWDGASDLQRMSTRITDVSANQVVVTTFEDGADQIRRRFSNRVLTPDWEASA